MASTEDAATWLAAYEPLLDGGIDPSRIPDLGTRSEFDLEALATLEPDLIIAVTRQNPEDQYEALSQIAPTVAPRLPGQVGLQRRQRLRRRAARRYPGAGAVR